MFGAVVLAFIFYITVSGDLPAWLGVLGLAGAPQQAPATNATTEQPNLLNPALVPQIPGLEPIPSNLLPPLPSLS
jgi:hypothetical protein